MTWLGTANSAADPWETAAVVWAVVIAVWDVYHQRVPNVLVFPAVVAAVIHVVLSGSSPLGAEAVSVLFGLGLAAVMTLPGYLTRKLGAGDVKLLLAIAMLGGTMAVLTSFVVGALAIAAVALAWLRLGPYLGLPRLAGKQLPFGTALALGFVVAVGGEQIGGLPWPR